MKAKVLGVAVMAVLALSLILTTIGLATYTVDQQPAAPRGEQLVNQLNANARDSADNTLVSALVFVCPFHK